MVISVRLLCLDGKWRSECRATDEQHFDNPRRDCCDIYFARGTRLRIRAKMFPAVAVAPVVTRAYNNNKTANGVPTGGPLLVPSPARNRRRDSRLG